MNQTAKCHQIQGCTGLYIDAFRAFQSRTRDIKSTFILTHYHSDHYSGLPRGSSKTRKNKGNNSNNNSSSGNGGGNASSESKAYNGPALIHCTPVTAALLRNIHNIESKFIVEHPYGCTWTHRFKPHPKAINDEIAKITFYDANHCPGAAIIHIHLVQQNKQHCHTGDMRFNLSKFSSYPLISKAAEQNKIDLLYLDTTYSKPKHDFIPQDEAIHMIASKVKSLLNGNDRIVEMKKKNFFKPVYARHETKNEQHKTQAGGKTKTKAQRTLVLLSCYSIGKEKVLWNAANESNQLVYVNKTKYKMLQCIQPQPHQEQQQEKSQYNTSSSGNTISTADASSNIITKCTTNPKESDLHVIQMGLAGSLFPFFKPNFEQVALYAHQLNKGYSKVVAFLPTGWANASKFNKENAISTKRILMQDLKDVLPPRTASKGCYGNDSFIDVEIHLVSYSEHSSYSELRSCVKYMKPRQIIPTVFSNEKDYNSIEHRFHDLVDSHRAKMAFIRSISGDTSIPISTSELVSTPSPPKPKPKIEMGTNYEIAGMSTLHNRKRKNNFSNTDSKSGVNGYDMKKRTIKSALKSEGMESQSRIENIDSNSNNNSSNEHSSQNTLVKNNGKGKQKLQIDDGKVAFLVNMGFDIKNIRQSLEIEKNNLEGAIEYLLQK
jgi:ribonuclease BN (tRNA processing enzyme)